MLVGALAAATVVGGVYLLLALLIAGQIGMGDVRLAAMIGLMLGPNGPSAVLLAAVLPYVLALPFALTVLAHTAPQHPRRPLPFGPFLVAAAVLTIVLTA